jgi:hypothetical protein
MVMLNMLLVNTHAIADAVQAFLEVEGGEERQPSIRPFLSDIPLGL